MDTHTLLVWPPFGGGGGFNAFAHWMSDKFITWFKSYQCFIMFYISKFSHKKLAKYEKSWWSHDFKGYYERRKKILQLQIINQCYEQPRALARQINSLNVSKSKSMNI